MNDEFTRSTKHRLDHESDGFQAALARILEDGQRQDLPVQVHCNVSLHFDREVFHDLFNVSRSVEILDIHSKSFVDTKPLQKQSFLMRYLHDE